MYDIRTNKTEQITEIRFADPEHERDEHNEDEFEIDDRTCVLSKGESGVVVLTDASETFEVIIACREDGENLIKALEKALEWGWFDE